MQLADQLRYLGAVLAIGCMRAGSPSAPEVFAFDSS
jgi:hypothetical protein